MKICLITRFYKPHVRGGAEIYVGAIAEKLKEKGHEVSVITLSNINRGYVEKINGVIINRINPLNFYNPYSVDQPLPLKFIYHTVDLFNLHSYLLVKNILSKEKPDVVHIHTYKGLSASVFKAVKDLNIPLIYTAHDFASLCVKTDLLRCDHSVCKDPRVPCKIYNRIHKNLLNKKVDLLTAPSRFVIDKLRSNGLFHNIETSVIPNAVELFNERVKKDYNKLDLVYVGSLSRHKGPDILIRAFKEIEGDNLRLHILGRGPDEGELRRLAEGDERITFHGFLSGDKLMDMYRMANVTVVPSIWYDNSPMVIYESLMNSTPAIASRIGGIPELVRDGYNGFLFEPGSVNGLRRILEEISDDPSILKELERNAYESSQGYSIEDHVKKLEEIYRGLL